jgi:hypothetical protein
VVEIAVVLRTFGDEASAFAHTMQIAAATVIVIQISKSPQDAPPKSAGPIRHYRFVTTFDEFPVRLGIVFCFIGVGRHGGLVGATRFSPESRSAPDLNPSYGQKLVTA